MSSKTKRTCRNDKTLGKLASQWLEQNRIRWKESTYSKYYYIVNSVISDTIGNLPISAVTAKVVQEQVNRMLTNGLSVITVKDYSIIVNNVLGFASRENYYCPERVDINYPQRQTKEIEVLNKKEQLVLVNMLKNSPDLTKLGVVFALYTGVRCGELCALQWKDINLSEQTVYISKTMQRIQNHDAKAKTKTKIITMPPKTRQSVRRIPLPQFLADMLSDFQCVDGEAYLLTGSKKRFIEPRSMQNKFKRYLSDCSIKSINFHALRHTFATRCIELGFDVKSLSEILGHSSVNITMNLYVHSSFDLKISNMNKLNEIAI